MDLISLPPCIRHMDKKIQDPTCLSPTSAPAFHISSTFLTTVCILSVYYWAISYAYRKHNFLHP